MLVITKITQAALFCRIHCSRKMDKFLRGRVGENFFIHILKSNYLSVKNYYKCHFRKSSQLSVGLKNEKKRF